VALRGSAGVSRQLRRGGRHPAMTESTGALANRMSVRPAIWEDMLRRSWAASARRWYQAQGLSPGARRGRQYARPALRQEGGRRPQSSTGGRRVALRTVREQDRPQPTSTVLTRAGRCRSSPTSTFFHFIASPSRQIYGRRRSAGIAVMHSDGERQVRSRQTRPGTTSRSADSA